MPCPTAVHVWINIETQYTRTLTVVYMYVVDVCDKVVSYEDIVPQKEDDVPADHSSIDIAGKISHLKPFVVREG